MRVGGLLRETPVLKGNTGLSWHELPVATALFQAALTDIADLTKDALTQIAALTRYLLT